MRIIFFTAFSKKFLLIMMIAGMLSATQITYAQNPIQVGSIVDSTEGALLKRPESVYVSGNYAYIASNESNALEIIDISNPALPTHKASLTNGTGGALLKYPTSVFVSGNYAYITSQGSNALEIVNISNPATPIHAGSLSDSSGGAHLKSPTSLYISNNYAYITSNAGGAGAFEIVDVGNPLAPVHKGSIVEGTVAGSLLDHPTSVCVSGNYAYLLSGLDNGSLEIIDISNPSLPVHRGSLVNGSGGAQLKWPQSIYVSGNYAYIASFESNALEIIDIKDPDLPVHKSSLTDADIKSLLNPSSVYISGSYAYVGCWTSGTLEVLDISDPSSPKYKSSVTINSGDAILSSPSSIFVFENFAYVTCYNGNSLAVISLNNSINGFTSANITLPIAIYPNPSKGEFQVIIPNRKQGKADIVNELGIIIKTIDLTEEMNQVNGLLPGFYFLKTEYETKKILVE